MTPIRLIKMCKFAFQIYFIYECLIIFHTFCLSYLNLINQKNFYILAYTPKHTHTYSQKLNYYVDHPIIQSTIFLNKKIKIRCN